MGDPLAGGPFLFGVQKKCQVNVGDFQVGLTDVKSVPLYLDEAVRGCVLISPVIRTKLKQQN